MASFPFKIITVGAFNFIGRKDGIASLNFVSSLGENNSPDMDFVERYYRSVHHVSNFSFLASLAACHFRYEAAEQSV